MTNPSRPRIADTAFDVHSFPALVFWTEQSDAEIWDEILDELAETEYSPVDVHPFTDAGWHGATAQEVLAALPSSVDLPRMVYLADTVTMTADGRPLLVVATTVEPGEERPTFRIEAGSVTLMHNNLALGHTGFWELVEAAARDPEGVVRD